MSKPTIGQRYGKYLATKMANHRPLTKYQMLRKWKSLGSVSNINQAINWIEANTALSDNSFLMIYDGRGSALWGFRDNFAEISVNLSWNYRYIRTRMATSERVLLHSIASPVVTMTRSERRAAKSIAAQAGGVVAYLDQMIKMLP